VLIGSWGSSSLELDAAPHRIGGTIAPTSDMHGWRNE
jgi:hypothetical protein